MMQSEFDKPLENAEYMRTVLLVAIHGFIADCEALFKKNHDELQSQLDPRDISDTIIERMRSRPNNIFTLPALTPQQCRVVKQQAKNKVYKLFKDMFQLSHQKAETLANQTLDYYVDALGN